MTEKAPSNTISDLRDHLFATMAALRDSQNPMELDRAKAIGDIAQTIINAAKVEVDLVRVMGDGTSPGSGFFNLPDNKRLSAPAPGQPRRLGEKTVHRFEDGTCDVCGAKQTDKNEFARCPGAL